MKTTKKERNENARRFYRTFKEGGCNEAAIVAWRTGSRCQFLAVPSYLAFGEEPLIIAESNSGIDGFFKEFLDAVDHKPVIKSYFDDDFNNWLSKEYGFWIGYRDGFVFMLEK